ncbi:DUF4245 domain-containing protein [Leucobacter sp. UCMA 4100]|uniref:DUF4245 domain-containing protein n=1 Tax=Leucobacter sp. UCMA 4100 TaxID=2810534 RepID=UPI0022EB997A|nr:DUF4245 domain-containing protein [Leucobacter sp. UCMA 4100]MDA3147700.1 DUF4245 domain-containing protein [Leucobacter sp. UCMA 4100]
MASKKPKIVAELGRPETPNETAARKAENSRLHRQRQTVNNLVYSLLASLGVVLILVLIVPRWGGDFEDRSVDVISLAHDASPTAGIELVAPAMPSDWLAKQATIRSSKADKVTQWYVGYTTPKPTEQFAAVVQAFTPEAGPANETWVAQLLESKSATGTEDFAGHTWTVYEHGDDDAEETNVLFAMSTNLDNSTLVVYGTDEPIVIRELAQAALDSL